MATHKLLNLTIARVDDAVFSGGVQFVTVPGTEGEMTLMADHEPLITALRSGTITYQDEAGERHSHDVIAGTLEVRDNTATILI